MGNIKTFHEIMVEDFPATWVSGGTATPLRMKKYYVKFDGAAGDELNVAAWVDSNISKIKSILYNSNASSSNAGTCTFSGTAITARGTPPFEVGFVGVLT